MKLYDGFAMAILNVLNNSTTATNWASTNPGSIGAAGSIDFFTNSADFTASGAYSANGAALAGMLNQSSRIKFSSTPISAFATGGNPAGVRATATFSFNPQTGTVSSAGSVSVFAVLNTNAGIATAGNIVFTGSVAASLADINFNVTAWSANDQVSITSLTFVQPE